MLTQNDLKALLSYDPLTGHFTWLHRTDIDTRVNIRDAGRIAGRVGGDQYISIGINGTNHLAHRLAFLYMTGSFPTGLVDHKNGIKSDNRWDNLRLATPQQNAFNSGISKNNTSGYKGVCWDKKNQKWMASIMVDRRSKHLGRFTKLEEAIAARQKAEQELFGDFSRQYHEPARKVCSLGRPVV